MSTPKQYNLVTARVGLSNESAVNRSDEPVTFVFDKPFENGDNTLTVKPFNLHGDEEYIVRMGLKNMLVLIAGMVSDCKDGEHQAANERLLAKYYEPLFGPSR